jgi:hypothetical protein
MISVIETSALQKLRQRYSADEAQQRPGHSDVQVKVFSGNQAQNATKTNDNYSQYINSYGSVGRTWTAAYAVKAQKAAYKQAYVKQSYHSHLSLFKNFPQKPLKPLSDKFRCLLDVVGFYIDPMDIQKGLPRGGVPTVICQING